MAYMGYPPKRQIMQVAGEAGAKAVRLEPMESVLAIDTTASIIWMIVADGYGNITTQPFDATPHKFPPSPQEQRLTRIEEMLLSLSNELSTLKQNGSDINEQSSITGVPSSAAGADSTVQPRKVVYANGAGIQQPS